MKTNAKKRMLISSVAMLLVAMIALGTATFAWFTQDTSATASKINVKTVKASELKLQSASIDWTDKLEYNFTDVLKPASSADGEAWFVATAATKSGYAAKADTIKPAGSYKTADNGISGYVFMDQLNVGNAGSADVKDVKITFVLNETATNGENRYLRLALVPTTGRATTDTLPDMTTFASNVYSVGADSADALTNTDGSTTTVTSKDASTTVTVDVGLLKGKTGSNTMGDCKYYNLFIWFEGQDENCSDANAGNEMPSITFSVTGNTVETTD